MLRTTNAGPALIEKLVPEQAVETTITISVTQHLVWITGEVLMPGPYPINDDLTLAHLIEKAGGLTEYADKSRISIRHRDGATEEHDYTTPRTNMIAQTLLKWGDHVRVPRRVR